MALFITTTKYSILAYTRLTTFSALWNLKSFNELRERQAEKKRGKILTSYSSRFEQRTNGKSGWALRATPIRHMFSCCFLKNSSWIKNQSIGSAKNTPRMRNIQPKKKTNSPGRARTCDLTVNSRALYLLSYGGIVKITKCNILSICEMW